MVRGVLKNPELSEKSEKIRSIAAMRGETKRGLAHALGKAPL
jgi:hypothetical protein